MRADEGDPAFLRQKKAELRRKMGGPILRTNEYYKKKEGKYTEKSETAIKLVSAGLWTQTRCVFLVEKQTVNTYGFFKGKAEEMGAEEKLEDNA